MPATSEAALLAQATQRLIARHTDIPANVIADAVQAAYAEFEGKPIRDFVPLLVERVAERNLGALAAS